MSDLQNIERALDGVSIALAAMPYHEDLEQGTQRRRDWIAVREHLRAAKARLVTMEAKQDA
jgi:hypothetical protein